MSFGNKRKKEMKPFSLANRNLIYNFNSWDEVIDTLLNSPEGESILSEKESYTFYYRDDRYIKLVNLLETWTDEFIINSRDLYEIVDKDTGHVFYISKDLEEIENTLSYYLVQEFEFINVVVSYHGEVYNARDFSKRIRKLQSARSNCETS
jgi:hypothetical protein